MSLLLVPSVLLVLMVLLLLSHLLLLQLLLLQLHVWVVHVRILIILDGHASRADSLRGVVVTAVVVRMLHLRVLCTDIEPSVYHT
jgi:hypothetical protein